MKDDQTGRDLARYSQIRETKVSPRRKTGTSVPSGRWSLSTLSSVPYVRLSGPGGYQKEFSWGEVIEVPEGAAGILENASFHTGDIILNGGHDWAAVPARITVPVTLGTNTTGRFAPLPAGFPAVPTPLAYPVTVIPSWGVDTRRARKAYLAIEWETADVPGDDAPPVIAQDLTFNIRGYAEQRSHETVDTIVGSGIGYETQYVAPAGTRFGIIPLGYSAGNGNDTEPMALLDYCNFSVSIADNFFALFKKTAYYIVEY